MAWFTLLGVTLGLRVSLPDRTRVGRISNESDEGSRRGSRVKKNQRVEGETSGLVG
jgi:hypothetical protein